MAHPDWPRAQLTRRGTARAWMLLIRGGGKAALGLSTLLAPSSCARGHSINGFSAVR